MENKEVSYINVIFRCTNKSIKDLSVNLPENWTLC